MKHIDNEIDENVYELFKRMRSTPVLGAREVAEQREKFLAHGELLRSTITRSDIPHHPGLKTLFMSITEVKWHKQSLTPLVVFLSILILLFIGGVIPVAVSQNSLPDQYLYPIKIWSEDLRLTLTSSLERQLLLTLDFSDRRVAELIALTKLKKSISDILFTRWLNELDAALIIASKMDDTQIQQALIQIQQHADSQYQIINSYSMTGSDQYRANLAQLKERLLEQVQLALAGESDPQGFRNQEHERQNIPSQTPNSTQVNTSTPTLSPTAVATGNGFSPGPDNGQSTGTPGHNGPEEPNPIKTPMPTGTKHDPTPGEGKKTTTSER